MLPGSSDGKCFAMNRNLFREQKYSQSSFEAVPWNR